MYAPTLRELFTYSDWAREKLFAMAAALSDDRLDRAFEMGPGSIRNTLHHLWAAEKLWLERWTAGGQPKFVFPEAGLPPAVLLDRARSTAGERDAFLARQGESDLARPLAFTNLKGESFRLPLGGQMLHVCNHGIHHRAQVTNMLRRVGGTLPQRGLDYIFYRLEIGSDPAPVLGLAVIRRYQNYADWGTRKLLAIAAGLPDVQLDRPFEMGMGTLRKTFCHLLGAETWWQANWTAGPAGEFPAADEPASIADLSRRFDDAWAARDRFVARLEDGELARPVTVRPRPDLTLQFPLGVSLMQLCGHATHHRAQAMNMLRHAGVEPPGLDLILWLREQAPSPGEDA
jgi:uncharacterized damage-inducible protein DinB